MARAHAEVVGLREFARELRQAGVKMPVQIREANKRAAAVVATGARAKAQSAGSTAAKAAPSIRAGGSQFYGMVRAGGARYPFYFGADFGAKRFKQFPPFVKGGRFVFPTIRERRVEAMRFYENALFDAFRDAFPS